MSERPHTKEHVIREAGYSELAFEFPMDEFSQELFAAFNNTDKSNLSWSQTHHPNEWSKSAWHRVAMKAKQLLANDRLS